MSVFFVFLFVGYTDNLKSWLGAGRVTDMMSAARDHDVWKDMIANAMRPGT